MQAIQYLSVSAMNVTYGAPHCRHCLIACSRKNVGFVALDWKLKDEIFTLALTAIRCVTGESHSTSQYSDTDRALHLQDPHHGRVTGDVC